MIALDCLARIQAGGFSQPIIESLGKPLSSADQRLLRQIVLGVLRHQSRLDSFIRPHVKKSLEMLDSSVLTAIRVGVFQVRILERVPAHAGVSTTVEAYKRLYGRKATGFVNGVLRSCLRAAQATESVADTVESLSQCFSQPNWLVRSWTEQLGFEATRALCEANNQPAPLTIRPQVQISRADLVEQLEAEGATVESGRWIPYALRLNHPTPFDSESFKTGLWTAQDEASQLVVELLDPQSKERIWDVCAAPGGKTLLIDWLTDGSSTITATDVSPRKTALMKNIMPKPRIDVLTVDARTIIFEQPFDRVLLDAPCSALGLVRRHPEIRWRREPNDVEQSAKLQAALLQNAAKHVAVGGVLVYSVCSSMPQEGSQQIDTFLESHAHFACEPPEKGRIDWNTLWHGNGIQLWPHQHETDSFFMTRLKRKE